MYHLLLAPGGRNIFIRALCCLLFWSYKLFKTRLNCMFKAPAQQSFHFQLNCPSLLQYFFSSSELQRITTHIWGLSPLCSKHLSCIILQKNKEVDIVFHRDQFGERKYDRTPTSNRCVFVSAASCKDLLTRLNRSTCHSLKCIGGKFLCNLH